jgi:hypothetical protein
MMLGFAVSVLWLLALVAGFVLFRDCGLSLRTCCAAGAALAIAFGLGIALSPQPNWIGVLVAVIAFWRLIGGAAPRSAPWLAGCCAGLAAALQAGAGVPVWQAGGITTAALALAMVAGRAGRSGLAGEWALVVVALAAPVFALAADLSYGWQSAAVLNTQVVRVDAPPPPLWAWIVAGLSLTAGLAIGAWRKR